MIQQFNSIRFGFCIGYSNYLENTNFHIKMVRFDDLISGHDWVKQISDKSDICHICQKKMSDKSGVCHFCQKFYF